MPNTNAFIERLQPAPVVGGFSRPDHWVWCGSCVRGDDGRYHLFASSWTKSLSFHPHWLTQSCVVRAVADRPEGPYAYVDDVLPPRGPEHWDGRSTHNPTIHFHDGTYYLYYTGMTYDDPVPTPDAHCLDGSPLQQKARANQMIGLATAPSPEGPWHRPDEPLLRPRPGEWDALMTTNPAPCIHDDGRTLLAYKSTPGHKGKLQYGMAGAPAPEGPFKRLSDEPIFQFESGDHVEDAYMWFNGDHYELIMKDMKGGICGERHAGVHATSEDGVRWTISDPPLAYSRNLVWADGSRTTQGNLERPQLLIENGRPTHVFFATTSDGKHFRETSHTYNLAIPLK